MHSFWLRIVLLSCFIVCVPASFAQESRNTGTTLEGQINGQVRFAEGGQPAFNVLVSCDSFAGGLVGQVMTDRSGRFRFTRLAPSQYNITVRLAGYFEERQTVELLTTPSGYVQFQLRRDTNTPPVAKPGVIDAAIPPGAKRDFEAASIALMSGKKESIAEAIRLLEKTLSAYPRFYQASLMLGTAYMDLGQWDKAESLLKQTLSLNPNAANASFALGELYLRKNMYDLAEKTLLEGLRIEPRSYQGHLSLARVYWDMSLKTKDEAAARSNLEKSYEAVKKTLELKPDLAEGHLMKGNLLFRVRRAADAQHEFEEYLRLNPNGPAAAQTRALVEKIKKALESNKPEGNKPNN